MIESLHGKDQKEANSFIFLISDKFNFGFIKSYREADLFIYTRINELKKTDLKKKE